MNGIPKSVVDWVEKLVNETVEVLEVEVAIQQVEINKLEDKVEDLICKVSELEDVVEDNYRHSIELAQDCANEVRDNTEEELEELSNRVDELEDEDDG